MIRDTSAASRKALGLTSREAQLIEGGLPRDRPGSFHGLSVLSIPLLA